MLSDDLVIRPFADTLRDLRRGTVVTELEEGLAEVVRAVEETGKAGKLTLTLTVKPISIGSVGTATVAIHDDVKATLPRERPGTVMFAADGVLTRNDPRQPELGLRTVNPATGGIHDHKEASSA